MPSKRSCGACGRKAVVRLYIRVARGASAKAIGDYCVQCEKISLDETEAQRNKLELVSQARALIIGKPTKIIGHEGRLCEGFRCIELHNVGGLNPSTFSGSDALWGPTASGWLCGEWDIHANRYTKLTGMFPSPSAGVWTEDLSEALK